MTSEPRAFLALDAGAASIAAALIGRVRGRWRLIGSLVLPSGADTDAVVAALVERAVRADPELAAAIGIRSGGAEEIARLEVASHAPRRLAVVAASDRSMGGLVGTAGRSGWRTAPASTESMDPLAMSALLLEPDIAAILVGAGEPPSADERRGIGELAAVVAAAASRRPDLTIVLAGAMADQVDAFGNPDERSGEVLLGPAAARGATHGPLADLLLELAMPAGDARRTLGQSAQTLAEVLDRRVDVVEIGYDAGSRIAAWPAAGNGPSGVDIAIVPAASLAPSEPDESVIDRVGTWSAWGADRHRLRDRMRELRMRRGPTRPARAWACGWRPPGRPSAAPGGRRGLGRAATGRPRGRHWRGVGQARRRSSRSPSSMSCVAPAWPSTPTTTPGSWRRSERSRIRSNGRP